MPTQKELIEAQRKGLEEEWKKKFPKGRFILQVRDSRSQSKKLPTKSFDEVEVNLAWEKSRRSSHTAPHGLVVSNKFETAEWQAYHTRGLPSYLRIVDGYLVSNSLNNTWAYVRYFDSIEALKAHARKLGVDPKQVEVFTRLQSGEVF